MGWKVRSVKLSTPTNLLVLEAGGGYEILDKEEFYEVSSGHEKTSSEEIVIIRGTVTVSF